MKADKVINGKEIYIVINHHKAVIPWTVVSEKIGEPLDLISFDYHPDTLIRFNAYRCTLIDEDKAQFDEAYELNKSNELKFVKEYVPMLRCDEHITFALDIGILKNCYIIINQKNEMPRTVIHAYKFPCKNDFDDPYVHYTDTCINCDLYSLCLENKLDDKYFEKLNFSLENLKNKYILDFDLDYFHTTKSLQPQNVNTLYNLIRNAEIITVSKSKNYFDLLKIDDFCIDDALSKLLNLIKYATQ